jgi:hypothetical protein
MKKLLIVAAAVVAVACGSAGHSASYNKGNEWATNSDLAKAQAGMMGANTICGAWATQQAQGLNQQEWMQGCQDALTKDKS